MGTKKVQPGAGEIWRLAERQHWLVTRAQLLGHGMSTEAIRHRLRTRRLHRVMRGVYLVGRRDLSVHGRWMAAVLACGPEALVSHRSAAELWGMCAGATMPVHVAVPVATHRRRPRVHVHRKKDLGPGVRREVRRVPVTDPVTTLVDFATEAAADDLEAAVNEASHLDLVDPETLRTALDRYPTRPGIRPLRALLDRDTFVLTQTKLERHFVPLALAAGLPLPESQDWLGRNRVDFHWPSLGLVVECDSLRYHRTPLKQAKDVRRDQAHTVAGRTPLRFTHFQIFHEPAYVESTLRPVAARLTRA